MLRVRIKKICRQAGITLLIFSVMAAASLLLIDHHVRASVLDRIVTSEEAAELQADCILVLGAGVRSGGVPSPMLEDRLKTGIALYQSGAAKRLLMSGDHGRKGYDEVNVMKSYALHGGVPSEAVFMDHAGFSTYESMYRARDIFGAKKIIIATQEYHLYRALYDVESLGLSAYGVAADARAVQRSAAASGKYWQAARAFSMGSCSPGPPILARRSR